MIIVNERGIKIMTKEQERKLNKLFCILDTCTLNYIIDKGVSKAFGNKKGKEVYSFSEDEVQEAFLIIDAITHNPPRELIDALENSKFL